MLFFESFLLLEVLHLQLGEQIAVVTLHMLPLSSGAETFPVVIIRVKIVIHHLQVHFVPLHVGFGVSYCQVCSKVQSHNMCSCSSSQISITSSRISRLCCCLFLLNINRQGNYSNRQARNCVGKAGLILPTYDLSVIKSVTINVSLFSKHHLESGN